MAESKYPLGYTGAKTKELLKKIDELDVDVLDILIADIVVPENADLDDYKTVGVYYVPTFAVAQTISNTPYKNSGFKLNVSKPATKDKNSASATIHQDIILGNSTESIQYTRCYIVANGKWSSWLEYATTRQVEAATSTSYTVTVPASAWATGSLTHLGQTYAYKAAVTVAAAKGAGKGLIVEPASGSSADLQAWGVVDVSAGKVILYSTAPLTGDITLRITEVF